VRPCPGQAQALALAEGVVEAVLEQGRIDAAGAACAVSPAFRLPVQVDVVLS
jgi:hypothetical protein